MDRSPSILLFALALAGCAGGPTREDAEQLLREGHAEAALRAARAAAEEARPEELPGLRRLAFDAGLLGGWSHEAAREYLHLRQLLGRDEPELLARLGRTALGSAGADPDPERRLAAAACAAWAPDGAELASLALHDPLPEVRGAVCASAARLPWPQSLLLLGEAARQDPSAWVRAEALRALAQAVRDRCALGDAPPSGSCLALAQSALGDPDPQVVELAVGLLATLARCAPEARGPISQALLAAARVGGPGARATAARALFPLDPRLAREAAGPDASAWQEALAEHPDLERLRQGLASPEYRERLEVCRSLRGALAVALLEPLAALAVSDPATPVRAAALEALTSAPSSAALPALRAALRHPHPATRRVALRGLLERRALERPEELALLEDEALAGELVRPLARSPEGLARLRELATGPTAAAAFRPALRQLIAREDAALHPRLLELLQERDPVLVTLAARGLAGTARPSDRAALVGVVANPAGAADVPAAAALLALEERARQQARPGSLD